MSYFFEVLLSSDFSWSICTILTVVVLCTHARRGIIAIRIRIINCRVNNHQNIFELNILLVNKQLPSVLKVFLIPRTIHHSSRLACDDDYFINSQLASYYLASYCYIVVFSILHIIRRNILPCHYGHQTIIAGHS
jgi:hypothetical protein